MGTVVGTVVATALVTLVTLVHPHTIKKLQPQQDIQLHSRQYTRTLTGMQGMDIHMLPCWYITEHQLGITTQLAVSTMESNIMMVMDGISTPKHAAIMNIPCIKNKAIPIHLL